MQIYGLFSNAGVTRPTTPGASPASEPVEGKSPASAALLLGTDEDAGNRAAAAKKKLDDIKEQLRMLRFFASDPETLARLAKQLAQQLGTAAQQLAGADGSAAASGVVSAAAVAALADAGSAQTEGAVAGNDAAASLEPANFAERAYREFSDDDAESGASTKVAAELKSVAEQIKQLLRKAEQELRSEGSAPDADDARAAGHALSAAVGKLGGIDTSAGNAFTFPSSVSI
ncbi:hypothetical protein PWG15_03525 [Ensifer adhaerens]|uniref:hypothetical protein n=1 Tax=Ensifer adhaerens TaxID=106592 RepID=UPI0023A9513A|nr:hypothetical protein [Ensifer adhaerens]WDZ77595.1 hypothetical protein PWG15_03525 [Ensifer adhaerens]